MTSQTPAPLDPTPIDDFSQCHAGIAARLHDLARLPQLLEPAREAKRIAGQTPQFFRDVVYEHHADEERELFPAVLASAAKGAELDEMRAIVDRLAYEHRQIESAWTALEPALEAVAKDPRADVDAVALQALVNAYLAHARYEEEAFLPRAQQILGRDRRHMAALGSSLHLRHAVPELLKKSGFRG